MYLRNALNSSHPTLTNHFAVLVATINARDQFLLTHHWNVDAIGSSDSSERNVSLYPNNKPNSVPFAIKPVSCFPTYLHKRSCRS